MNEHDDEVPTAGDLMNAAMNAIANRHVSAARENGSWRPFTSFEIGTFETMRQRRAQQPHEPFHYVPAPGFDENGLPIDTSPTRQIMATERLMPQVPITQRAIDQMDANQDRFATLARHAIELRNTLMCSKSLTRKYPDPNKRFAHITSFIDSLNLTKPKTP
jgi:hypothetical protein